MPIDWGNDNNARMRLRKALAKQDPKARFADTLCEDAGVDQSRVDFNGVGESIWFSVIEEAKKAGKLPSFVTLAVGNWPDNKTLEQLATDTATAPPASRPESPTTPLALGAGVVVEVMAERVRDPLEKVLSDLQIADAAQWLADYQTMMGRVALVQTGGLGSGTGFLIAPDLLLTNWHVVECVHQGRVAPAEVKVRFDFWRPPGGLADRFVDVKLAEAWLGDHSPWSQADFDPTGASVPKPDELDYAVLQLARPIGSETRNGAPRGWVTIPKQAPVTPGQSVLILQHPNGHPLRLAFDGVLQMNDNGTRVRYRTNTQGGSSGSPCFDQNWKLLALHHAGDPRLSPVYNEGIPAEAIRALIERHAKVMLPAAGS